MSDTTPTDAPEPQSISEVQGTLSQVAREAAEAPAAPEPAAPVPGDLDLDLEPELLDEVIDEPALQDSPEVSDDEAPADPFAELGADRATVEAALRMHQATQTEDGVIQLFIEAGKQLGLGLDKIEQLFTGEAPAAPAAGEEEYDYDKDPDRPLTVREFQELTAAQQQAYRQAQQAQQAEQARAAATQTVHSTVAELGLTMEDEATQVILTLGNKYLPPGTTDPAAVKSAVERGHADYLALVEKERKAYIASKRQAANGVPTAPAGGAAPSTPEPAEPSDTAEAIKRARAMFRDKGVLK